jgi:hypothetical protein
MGVVDRKTHHENWEHIDHWGLLIFLQQGAPRRADPSSLGETCMRDPGQT